MPYLKNPEMFNALILSNPFWITSSRKTLMRTFSTALNGQDYSNTIPLGRRRQSIICRNGLL
jgi:hypothetical protein